MYEEGTKQAPERTIEERIKSALVAGLDLKVEPATIADDLPLVERGLGLDSLAILQLIGFMEEEFGIEIVDTDINRALFRDVRSLAGYVRGRLAQAATA